MPKVTVNGQEIEVPARASVLHARAQGWIGGVGRVNLRACLLALAAMGLSVPAVTHAAESSIEEQLAQCIFERDRSILVAIRDAANEQEFVTAFRRGVALCEYPEQEYSLGRFFTALNQLLRANSQDSD